MKKLSIILVLGLSSLPGGVALAGVNHAFSHCVTHSYGPGTVVNGCGSFVEGCPGICGFTMAGQTYYYYTCSFWPFTSCEEYDPHVAQIKADAGACVGSMGNTCDCQHVEGTISIGIILPQCA